MRLRRRRLGISRKLIDWLGTNSNSRRKTRRGDGISRGMMRLRGGLRLRRLSYEEWMLRMRRDGAECKSSKPLQRRMLKLMQRRLKRGERSLS